MDVRLLLLYIVFYGICLCKQSSPLPMPTLHRAFFTLDGALEEVLHQRSSHGSHSQEENGKPEGLIAVHESERVHIVSPSTGVFPLARRLLLFGERKFLSIKAQDDKEKVPAKRDHRNTGSANLEKAEAKLLDDTSNNNSTKSGDEGTRTENGTQSAPPPPFKLEDKTPKTPTEDKKKEVNTTKSNSGKSDDGTKQDDSTHQKAKSCGGSSCEDLKKLVSACLRVPGDGAHKFSLFITYEGDSNVTVKVAAPEYLIADVSEVLLSKGKNATTIEFTMDSKYESSKLDAEAVKDKTINVTTICQIGVPTEYLPKSVQKQKPQFSSYLPLMTSRVVAYLLVFVLIVSLVGAWSCYKCCGKKRAADAVKYQQLEMIVPGQSSTPKEREESSTDRWDEVWDEDWEDAEAVKSSSRLTQNLSSRGLAARRGNKDGWDTSWDD
eukprot:c15880_g1_i1 orf=705-2015(-)